jgi:hypothetical protein
MMISRMVAANGRTLICVCTKDDQDPSWTLSVISLANGFDKGFEWHSPYRYQSSEEAIEAGKKWASSRA